MGPVTHQDTGHQYYLLAPTNWTAAQREALSLGGNLVTIRDGEEEEWIWQTFGAYGGRVRNLWIGLADVDRDGVFTWASGEPLDYTNWFDGEPNRFGDLEYYACLSDGSLQWNDLPDLPGPEYGANFVPYAVVEVVSSTTVPPFQDAVRITGIVPAGQLRWTNAIAADALYAVESATSVLGPWGVLPELSHVEAKSASVSVPIPAVTTENRFYRVRWLEAAAVEPQLPLHFVDDAYLVSPGQEAQLTVADALGRVVAATNLVYGVTGYWSNLPDNRLEVGQGGTVRFTGGSLLAPFVAFRCLASYRGIVTTNQAFIVAHPQDGARTVFRSDEWRLFLPTDWINNAVERFPDFGIALDLGRLAQKELLGWTYAETWNAWDPRKPAVPWEAIAEDPNACGYSGTPIGFGKHCFFAGLGGDPWWPAIFHELGHNSSSLVVRIMYGELTYGAGLYVEGDANLLSRWSGESLADKPALAEPTRASIRRQFDENRRIANERLREWEAQTAPLDDRHGDWMWEGIHLRISERFGWEYFRRYVRAWRRDDHVRLLLAGPAPSSDWYVHVTREQRATFMAAAVSAAVEEDLRQEFRNWRFPVDDALFEELYEHLTTAMDDPL